MFKLQSNFPSNLSSLRRTMISPLWFPKCIIRVKRAGHLLRSLPISQKTLFVLDFLQCIEDSAPKIRIAHGLKKREVIQYELFSSNKKPVSGF